jgi:hypothetical protein
MGRGEIDRVMKIKKEKIKGEERGKDGHSAQLDKGKLLTKKKKEEEEQQVRRRSIEVSGTQMKKICKKQQVEENARLFELNENSFGQLNADRSQPNIESSDQIYVSETESATFPVISK